jgi:hypothetical protein
MVFPLDLYKRSKNMIKELFLTAFIAVSLSFSPLVFANGHMHGSVDASGNVNMHDASGKHYHGHIDAAGNVNMHDQNGKHYHGHIDDSGNVNMHDDKAKHYHGHAGEGGGINLHH